MLIFNTYFYCTILSFLVHCVSALSDWFMEQVATSSIFVTFFCPLYKSNYKCGPGARILGLIYLDYIHLDFIYLDLIQVDFIHLDYIHLDFIQVD